MYVIIEINEILDGSIKQNLKYLSKSPKVCGTLKEIPK